jgi:hypothetical protein
MLYTTCIGNQGLYINKIKVRNLLKLDYLLGLLRMRDSFTPHLENTQNMQVFGEEAMSLQVAVIQFQHKTNSDFGVLGSNPFDKVKVEIAQLIYHLYFDGSRENSEVELNRNLVLEFLTFEQDRIDKLVENKFSAKYYEYLFLHLIRIVRCFYS